MGPGYGLATPPETVTLRLWANTGRPQDCAHGQEARLPSDTLVTVQNTSDHRRWSAGPDETALLAWAADRAAGAGPHLVPVLDVGRDPVGTLVVDVLRPTGTTLSDALDRIGSPTPGVAVTLSVPLLELACAERDGALLVGCATVDDLLVDDSGAVVLHDRPPEASTPDPVPPTSIPASRVLLLGARMVWERVDPRDEARAQIDALMSAALDGSGDDLRRLLAGVGSVAAPRPVRWDPPADDFAFTARPSMQNDDDPAARLLSAARSLVERGIPLTPHRRLSVRQAMVGAVLAVGIAAAVTFSVGR